MVGEASAGRERERPRLLNAMPESGLLTFPFILALPSTSLNMANAAALALTQSLLLGGERRQFHTAYESPSDAIDRNHSRPRYALAEGGGGQRHCEETPGHAPCVD